MTIEQWMAVAAALFGFLITLLSFMFKSTLSNIEQKLASLASTSVTEHLEHRINGLATRVDRLSDVSRLFGEQIAVFNSANRSDGARLESIDRHVQDLRERVSAMETGQEHVLAKLDTLVEGSFPRRMPKPPKDY